MNDLIKVWFGSHITNPEIIHVMKQGEPIEYIQFEGSTFPVYDGELETWLARTDMKFTLYSLYEDNLSLAEEKWQRLVKASLNPTVPNNEVKLLKNDFLSLVA